jgi:hypothetical protein
MIVRCTVPLVSPLVSAVVVLASSVAFAQTEGGTPPGADFARSLTEALVEGPAAQDHLWDRTARSDADRELDARVASLFEWTDVTATVEQVQDGPDGTRLVDLVVRGTATWKAAARGVAESFWTLQTDESAEINPIVRRERWTLGPTGLALSREVLSPLEVVEARLDVGVYPGQGALLLEGSLDVRALVDGVRAVRFLLDRRAYVYDFRVNGRMVEVVRGNELGSLGLEGFSPELESSFRLPEPLQAGDQAVIRFRLREPLSHMTLDNGVVTSLPLDEGVFRERLWVPVLAPSGGESARLDLTLHWPQDSFDGVAVGAAADGGSAPADRAGGDGAASVRSESVTDAALEEERVHVVRLGDLRDLDFVLLPPGVSELPEGAVATGAQGAVRTFRRDPAGRDMRTRAALVNPLLDASASSSRDLANELQDLLPMDQELLDELFDDGNSDAERGADDRSAG